MAIAVQPFEGTYELDQNHSSFQFAVTHLNVSTFRASFGEIDGRLADDGGVLVLEGQARAESISIVDPPSSASTSFTARTSSRPTRTRRSSFAPRVWSWETTEARACPASS